MTFVRSLDVPLGPKAALQAVVQAFVDLDLRAIHVRPRAGTAAARTSWERSLHLGFHVLGGIDRVSEDRSTITLEVTPFLGSWAKRDGDELLAELERFVRLNADAPGARLKEHRMRPRRWLHLGPMLGLSLVVVVLSLVQAALFPLAWVPLVGAALVLAAAWTGLHGGFWRELGLLASLFTLVAAPASLILFRFGRLQGHWGRLSGPSLALVRGGR